MLEDVNHSSRATTGILRHNQVHHLGSNQQPSGPFGRLLRGGWTSTCGPFPAQRGRAGAANPTPGTQTVRGMARPEFGLEKGSGLTLRGVNPSSRATVEVPRHNQVHLLGSNQQLSRPTERLLRGGWSPTHGLFRAQRGPACTANPTTRLETLGGSSELLATGLRICILVFCGCSTSLIALSWAPWTLDQK